MKRLFAAICVIFCLGLTSRAQVLILNDNMMVERMTEIKASVLDSLTNEPIAFASVYVVPSKDTTITNFTLTDANGKASLDEVPQGSYTFHVEMMGYKSFVKERYFRDSKVDMGTIRLQEDENYLNAAVVSDVGNPIVVKKDTVEFNASSFHVGANAMLKDLLERMPGMEITEDGKVKFNGEEIDKLTVGGRTFFFNDQSTALNNLPASIVDKIRVIDRDSEATRASGVQDGNREKVLDVGLKKEYEKGWFGNAGIKGGTTLVGDDNDSPLKDDRGMLYNANALLSAYGEKDQLTVVASGQNINDSNMILVAVDSEGNETSSDQGLSSAGQIGANVNTTRIKDVESTVSVNYKYSDTDSGNMAARRTYQDDGDLDSRTERSGRQFSDDLSANLEFKKEKGKVWFYVRPSFRHNETNSLRNGSSQTMRDGSFVNSSENRTSGLSTSNRTDFDASVTFRDLWGKKKRSISLNGEASFDDESGRSNEYSMLSMVDRTDIRDMRYDTDGNSIWVGGAMGYMEPVGDKLMLTASAGVNWSRRGNLKDAFDAGGRNDYYSSESRSKYIQQRYDLSAQYELGKQTWLTLGGRMMGVLNEVYSKSFGMESLTGEDIWDWNLVPNLRFTHSKGMDYFTLSMSGYSQRPSPRQLSPALDISDPSRVGLGNNCLRPYTQTNFFSQWSRNNTEKFSTLMLYFFGDIYLSPVIYARWYDPDGILYSIPVNSIKPTTSLTLSLNYTAPLDSQKNWSLNFSSTASYRTASSYQATTALSGLDKDRFDYASFMSAFWGDEEGGRFYSGKSGFAESRTKTFNPSAHISVKYNKDRYSVSVGTTARGNLSRYSLNPEIDMNTLNWNFNARGSYNTKHEFEFASDLAYCIFKGYADGYGQPEWRWNAEISKNIKAFNLSIKLHDILDQTRSLSHVVTANYEEDSYSLVMGRYILFGVKWNFGKMNSAHSQRAQNAAWNMAW